MYLYVIMWLATVVCKTNLIAQDSRSTLCAHVIKGPTGVSNTLESSVNSTPHLGKLGGGADINKYNEGLLLSNERLESYTRSANQIIGITDGQSKLPGQSGSGGMIQAGRQVWKHRQLYNKWFLVLLLMHDKIIPMFPDFVVTL